jgi:hypothetical protein
MLHTGGQGHHGEVVGVGDRVEIAGKAERKWGERNTLRQTAAGGGSLNIEGRAAAGLANGTDRFFADYA